MAAPSQRAALGALFLLLALAFAGVAYAAVRADTAAPGDRAWPRRCSRSGSGGDGPSAGARSTLDAPIRSSSSPFREERSRMPDPAKLRNVAVVGHRGTGKTSLVEAMLFQAGATQPARHRRGGHDRRRLGRGRAASGRCRSRRRSPTSNGRAARSTCRHAGRRRLPGGRDRGAARRRGRARRGERGDGRGGEDDPRLGSRRGARALAGRVREHARPRARRLLPHARAAPGAALRALCGGRAADRLRARADGHRRPAAHDART